MRLNVYKAVISEDSCNHLVKEKAINYSAEQHLNNPKKIVSMMCEIFHLDEMAEEYLYLISLNTKCKPIGIFEVAHGDVNSCNVGVREIMIRNILVGAVGFIILHNHPSGECYISEEDKLVTKRVKEAANLIGIDLYDHIIIGSEGRFYSMRNNKEI